MQKRGRDNIPPWQVINHNEYREYQGNNADTINFSSEVHLLADKLVPVMAIHPLKGSCANRPHTSNPQSGATQPTQDEDPQATSNPLEYLLALHRGKVKNPSQSSRSKLETSTFLRSTIIAAPSRLGGGNHQEKQTNPAAKHNNQVPLDAITQAMH